MKRTTLTVAAALAMAFAACTRDAPTSDDVSGPSYLTMAVGLSAEMEFDEGRYTGTYEWSIDKWAYATVLEGYAGDSFPTRYFIDVARSLTKSDITAHFTITLTNLTEDTVEFGVTEGTLDCEGGYSLEPGVTATCHDSVPLADTESGTHTLTITSYTDGVPSPTVNADYTFGEPTDTVGYPTVNVSDSDLGDFPDSASESRTYEYNRTFTCSVNAADYADGVDVDVYPDTAQITETGQSAEWSVTVTCSAGFMDLLKLTDGAVDAGKEWSFKLYEGPDGFEKTLIGSSTTLGVTDGVLTFGGPALDPTTTYTVCELNVPAGYSSLWQIDGTIINPYNPDADAGQDLGNRCADFGAKTTMPLTVGATIRFQVDNTHPGGDPRSSGYWKNWNACTAGGQAATAALNGGYKEGFWLLEDVLDPSIGGGIEWPDLTVKSCKQAIAILDQRVVTEDGRGKKLANDAARTLAMQLLAAQLNLGAGACSTPDVQNAVVAAEELLDKIDFDGTKKGAYLTAKSGAPYREALRLAAILNTYNNGGYCGSTQ